MVTLSSKELIIISAALYSCKSKVDTESCQPGTSVTYYSFNKDIVQEAINILEDKVSAI